MCSSTFDAGKLHARFERRTEASARARLLRPEGEIFSFHMTTDWNLIRSAREGKVLRRLTAYNRKVYGLLTETQAPDPAPRDDRKPIPAPHTVRAGVTHFCDSWLGRILC